MGLARARHRSARCGLACAGLEVERLSQITSGAIERMTEPQNPNGDGLLDTAIRPDARRGIGRVLGGSALGPTATAVPMAIFLFISVFMAADISSDLAAGSSPGHLIAEAVVMATSLIGLVAMWRLLRATMQWARDLEVALDGTRADLVRWRSEAQEHLRGLGVAIDRQFDRWGLSPAEREVALLLLKGLSLKEAAEARQTSERTVRQQALAVYRKAGLAGRAELAAFFLEDLLLPRDPAALAPEFEGG
jgi:DNA-binding CsgD family transcriptional regulator